MEDEKSKPKRKPKGKKDKPKKEKKGEVKEEDPEDAELKAKKKEVEKKAKKACAGGLGLHDRAKKTTEAPNCLPHRCRSGCICSHIPFNLMHDVKSHPITYHSI